MADAPPCASGKPYKNGSSLAYDGGDTIFALKGSYNEFAAYSITGNNWVTKDNLPLVAPPSTKKTKVKDGSQIAYAGRVVYALKGGKTDEFWTYKCNDHTWSAATPLTPGSKKVKGGGALVTARDVNALYAFRGNNTLEFWKYGPIATFAFAPRIGNELKDEAQGQSAVHSSRFALSITPNPFTSRASISYSLPNAGNVSLRLYDISGKLVVTLVSGYRPAGAYSYSLLTTHYPPARGVYLLKFASEGCSTTEKLIIE
jgi:hypothetical protein